MQARNVGGDAKRTKLVALIEHMDDGIGRVIRTLRETDQADNTLIVFTSDNGGQTNVGGQNGPLRDGKQSMYEGGIKVPACAVWPERIQPGGISDVLGMTMDLFPTLCEAAGAGIDHHIDGVSILSVLTGQASAIADRDVSFIAVRGMLATLD